jgi:tRNA threonylcarbamoyl adenosine modification protein YjeE
MGSLGAGKTQIAKGFAQALGVRDVVNSPSFTLMAEYEGRLALFHQDLYRLEGAEEAVAGGLLDERQDQGVTLTEWADRLGGAAGAEQVSMELLTPPAASERSAAPIEDAQDAVPDEPREIVLRAAPGYERYLERASTWPGDVAR